MIIPFLKLIVERFRDDPEAPPALYIGDSVLGKISSTDTDTENLGMLVRAGLGTRCVVISMPSYTPFHMANYARFLKSLPLRSNVVSFPFGTHCLLSKTRCVLF